MTTKCGSLQMRMFFAVSCIRYLHTLSVFFFFFFKGLF